MKKTSVIIIQIIPIVSAVISAVLIRAPYNTPAIRQVIAVTTVLAFLGFAAYFLGRKCCRGDKAVRVLGILDWLATFSVFGMYILAAFLFGL